MVYEEVRAMYCKNHTKHIQIGCEARQKLASEYQV